MPLLTIVASWLANTHRGCFRRYTHNSVLAKLVVFLLNRLRVNFHSCVYVTELLNLPSIFFTSPLKKTHTGTNRCAAGKKKRLFPHFIYLVRKLHESDAWLA